MYTALPINKQGPGPPNPWNKACHKNTIDVYKCIYIICLYISLYTFIHLYYIYIYIYMFTTTTTTTTTTNNNNTSVYIYIYTHIHTYTYACHKNTTCAEM